MRPGARWSFLICAHPPGLVSGFQEAVGKLDRDNSTGKPGLADPLLLQTKGRTQREAPGVLGTPIYPLGGRVLLCEDKGNSVWQQDRRANRELSQCLGEVSSGKLDRGTPELGVALNIQHGSGKKKERKKKKCSGVFLQWKATLVHTLSEPRKPSCMLGTRGSSKARKRERPQAPACRELLVTGAAGTFWNLH